MVRYRECVGTDKFGIVDEFTDCKCPGEGILFDHTISAVQNIPWAEIDNKYGPENYR